MKEVSRLKAKAALAQYVEDWVEGQRIGVDRYKNTDIEDLSEYEKIDLEEHQCNVDVGVEVIKYLCGGNR